MDYEKLKEVIAKQIKENGRGEITGPVLQAVLVAMVDSLGEVYPQTYTDEQKAQARANIDALSNYDGEITMEKLSTEVQAILNDVANKQNIVDRSLETFTKSIVGAINEIYNGGVKGNSIGTSKIKDGAVTTDKLADTAVTEDKLASQSVSSEKIKDATIGASKLGDNSVTISKIKNEAVTEDKIANYSISMSKLRKANIDYSPDLGSAVYHSLQITLAYNGGGGSLTLSCNGVTWTSMRDATKVIEHVMSSTGIGVTLYISEPRSRSSIKHYVGTVVGVSVISGSEEISAIIRDGYDTNYTFNKDYFVVIKDYQFTTKICLTDQLPKIAPLETDVTALQGLINTKVKFINEDTDLNTITEDGLYLLSAGRKYTNYPLSDGTISAQYALLNSPALLIVSRRYTKTQISQVVLSVSKSYLLPLIRTRDYNGTNWLDWNDDYMYKTYNDAENSLDKYQDFLSDTVINNIWDNN